MSSPSREIVLGNIRKALHGNPAPMPFPEADKQTNFFVHEDISPEEKFAAEFNK